MSFLAANNLLLLADVDFLLITAESCLNTPYTPPVLAETPIALTLMRSLLHSKASQASRFAIIGKKSNLVNRVLIIAI